MAATKLLLPFLSLFLKWERKPFDTQKALNSLGPVTMTNLGSHWVEAAKRGSIGE